MVNHARLAAIVPRDYSTPSFPSLYEPIDTRNDVGRFLYYSSDIWRFTLFWTLLMYAAVHFVAGVWAVAVRPNKQTIGIPLVFLLVGGVEAVFAGSVVGLLLGAVYNAGPYKMSTWIPFVWGLVNILVLILSSFSLQGGL